MTSIKSSTMRAEWSARGCGTSPNTSTDRHRRCTTSSAHVSFRYRASLGPVMVDSGEVRSLGQGCAALSQCLRRPKVGSYHA